jgi:hypothetical protein
MALKNFRDESGNEWRVWDVVPHVLRGGSERRINERRRGGVMAYSGPERRTGKDRRLGGVGMVPSLGAGWLCFESGSEKRRLTPIPAGWADTPAEELQGLLKQAHPVSRRLDCETPER